MDTTKQKSSIANTVAGLSMNLISEARVLDTNHTSALETMQRNHKEGMFKLLEDRANEIASRLKWDVSETGVAMRELLMHMRDKGNYVTYEPLHVKGLSELRQAKLVDTYVNPISLWADVDTYETDPTTYKLTLIGKKVAEFLPASTLRKEFVGAPDSD